MKEIGKDFQGWKVNAITLGELLHQLGIIWTEDDGTEIIIHDRLDLNSYIRILEDDGMGYGVNPKYITSVDTETYQDDELGEKVFNIFVDPISKEE